MNQRDHIQLRVDLTEEFVLKEIDRIVDEADEKGGMSPEDIHELAEAWKALLTAKQCLKIS